MLNQIGQLANPLGPTMDFACPAEMGNVKSALWGV
jgi:hypothetical protein